MARIAAEKNYWTPDPLRRLPDEVHLLERVNGYQFEKLANIWKTPLPLPYDVVIQVALLRHSIRFCRRRHELLCSYRFACSS